MSIFFNQRASAGNPDTGQFYNGSASLSTSTTSSPFTTLDGRTFAQRYPITFGVYMKAENHYQAGFTPERYAFSRTITGTFIDQALNRGARLLSTDLGCDDGAGGSFDTVATVIYQSLQDKWDGVFSGGTVASAQNPFGAGVSQTGRWFFIAAQFNSPSDIVSFIIDPDDGAVLLTQQKTDTIPSTSDTTAATQFKLSGAFSTDTTDDVDNGLSIGEALLWDEQVSLAELQAFAQVGFGHINRPQNLILDWNFLIDWRATNALDTIDDKSPSGATGTFNKAFGQLNTGWNNFSTDNPVPVFIPTISGNEHDVLELSIFSGTAGTCYFGIYPAAATPPTEAEIVAGTNALSTNSILLDGSSSFPATIAQPDTGTAYVCYLVQDENDSGAYGPIIPLAYTSATKYSQNVGNAAGDRWVNKTGIRWAWFDEVEPQNWGSPRAKGSGESVDADGLLEITLPLSISTPKGGRGTMALYATFDDGEQAAYHPVTVK